MKKIIYPCFFMLSLHSLVQAQTTQELLLSLEKSKQDTSRVTLLLTLSEIILLKSGAGIKEIDSSNNYMKQAQLLSRELDYATGEGRSLLMAAMIANKKGDKDKGLILSEEALAFFTKRGDLKNEAEANRIIGQHYGDSGKDLDIRISYYKKAVALSEEARAKEQQANTLVDLAELQALGNNLKESLENLRTALAIYQSINYKKKLHGLYNLMGSVFTDMGDLVNGLKYELLSLKAAEDLKDNTLQLCDIYNHVGMAYYNLKKYKQSNIYYEKAIVIAKEYGDVGSIATVMLNQVNSLIVLNKVDAALGLLQAVVRTGYFKTDEYTMTLVNWLFADLYLKKKDFDTAYLYLQRFDQDVKDTHQNELENLNMHIQYYFNKKQFSRCYPFFTEFAKKYKDGRPSRTYMYNQLYWFKTDSSLGRYADAIKHYQLFKTINDSLYTIANDKQALSLQIEYETEKKDKDLLLLKKQSQLQDQEAKADRDIMICGFSAFVLLLGIGYNRFRLKQRSNLQLRHKQNEIDMQNSTLQSLVSEKDILINDKDILLQDNETLLQEKDELLTEKDWLLKEVHHRVKNNLQIVISLLNTQSAFLENTHAISALRESQNRVQSIALIHQKLYSSTDAASINMNSYIQDMLLYLKDCYATDKHRIRIHHAVDDIMIDITQAVPVGLILNEAVTNAIKYAFGQKGGELTVDFQRTGTENLLLTITDNGAGISEEIILTPKKSLGMQMMKILSKQLGGSFTIQNTPGATIRLEFPFEKMIHTINA